jgi:hypothetical protein
MQLVFFFTCKQEHMIFSSKLVTYWKVVTFIDTLNETEANLKEWIFIRGKDWAFHHV